MATMMLTIARTLRSWFRPALDAIFAKNLPLDYRWRLLLLQPISLLTYSIGAFPYLFKRPYDVEYLPVVPGRTIRVIVLRSADSWPESRQGRNKLRPLHLDIHGGAFLGGLPESNVPFLQRVANETGAVVVSTSYRYAPAHPFPAAIDDVDAVLAYLCEHAGEDYGADPDLVTVSGDSAGGNLALAAALSAPRGTVKASVTFYAVTDLRLSPWEKRKPHNFPKRDPMSFLQPLYDSYAGPARHRNMENARMSPILAKADDLPEDMLLVVPAIDILVHEQLAFAERVKEDVAKGPQSASRRVETLYVEKGFHGYLGLPSSMVPQELKDQAFDAGVQFIRNAHRKHGWQWQWP